MTSPANSSVWGPLLWKVLHIMAEEYPVEPSPLQQEQGYNFFHSLGFMLPCEMCRNHYQEYMNQHDSQLSVALKSRNTLAEFVIDFHNQVNKRLDKPQWTNIEQTRQKYQHMHKFDDNANCFIETTSGRSLKCRKNGIKPIHVGLVFLVLAGMIVAWRLHHNRRMTLVRRIA